MAVTPAQLLAILRTHPPFRQLFARAGVNGRSTVAVDEGDENNSDDAGYGGSGSRRRRRPKNLENRFPKVPSEEGRALMRSGIYGSRDHFSDVRRRRKNNISERLMWRRLGFDPRGSHQRANRLISQVCLLSFVICSSAADILCGTWCHRRLWPTRSSTMTLERIAANSQTMAISSSPAHRISKFACTTRRTPTNGNIIRPSTTHLASGPSLMPRYRLTIVG
jgi:hypothetical protein